MVQGMACGHCVDAVTSEVSGLASVTQVDVDLASGRVRVVSDGPVDADAVRAAVAEAGYEVVTACPRPLRPRGSPSQSGSLAVARSAGRELRS